MIAMQIAMRNYIWRLTNLIRKLTGRNFKLVDGMFGPRVALTGDWSPKVGWWMSSHGIEELELNYIYDCKIGESYAFLDEIPFIKALRIVHQDASDFHHIENLKDLRSLQIELCNKPKNFQIDKLKNLEILEIDWFAGAEALFNCPSIRKLSIDHFPKNLGSGLFKSLPLIEDLRIANSGLEEIENIRYLHKLKRLQLLNLKHLRALNGIENLRSLIRLRVDGCKQINSIFLLRSLENLEFLWLIDCGDIDSLDAICGLTKLQSVLFGGSTVIRNGDLSPLLDLPSLEHWGFANLKHYNVKQEDPRLAKHNRRLLRTQDQKRFYF